MKVTNGLNLTVEETRTIFNPNLFRLYDFYKFSKDGNMEIWQLVKIEDEKLIFLVKGCEENGCDTRYRTTTTMDKYSNTLNGCNIELIPYNEVLEILVEEESYK